MLNVLQGLDQPTEPQETNVRVINALIRRGNPLHVPTFLAVDLQKEEKITISKMRWLSRTLRPIPTNLNMLPVSSSTHTMHGHLCSRRGA